MFHHPRPLPRINQHTTQLNLPIIVAYLSFFQELAGAAQRSYLAANKV